MSVPRQTFPIVHYIWVGPPPKETGGEPGHDVLGPVKMASLNSSNPLQFWCLEEQQQKYIERFKQYKNITVVAIESFLKIRQSKESIFFAEAAATMTILSEHLRLERNTVRDKVSVKNIFSLFLLLSQGGYVADTNIIPATSVREISLPTLYELYVPRSYNPDLQRYQIDYWIMYSQQAGLNIKTAFDCYVSRWQQVQKIYDQEKYSENYYISLARILSRVIIYDRRIQMPSATR
jgi:hypothetical protein